MTPCEKHADREGALAVDLPSLGIKRYMCAECREAMLDRVSSPRQAARRGESFWSGYDDRSTDGRLLRHEYDGTFKQHTIDRSKE